MKLILTKNLNKKQVLLHKCFWRVRIRQSKSDPDPQHWYIERICWRRVFRELYSASLIGKKLKYSCCCDICNSLDDQSAGAGGRGLQAVGGGGGGHGWVRAAHRVP